MADAEGRVYSVGGSVRDELLGLPVSDRDWVVVGSTPQAMIARGYRAVGRDFPVFLHPQTHEEYALARTERKAGPGYHGFEVQASPDVTLEQDLARRDLTINAMARAEDGSLVDPYGGRRDLESGLLRHVSEAFAEDPVRILRLARFAARFTTFRVAPDTLALCRRMVEAGEVDALVAERVWQELSRGLCEAMPSRMLAVLDACGALERVLPEVCGEKVAADGGGGRIVAGLGASDPARAGSIVEPAGRAAWLGERLDRAAGRQAPLAVRFALLAAARPAGVAANLREVQVLCARLRVPTECADLARLLAGSASAGAEDAETALAFIETNDGLRRPGRFEALLLARELLAEPGEGEAPPRPATGPQVAGAVGRRLLGALAAARAVEAGAIAREGGEPAALAARIRAARLAAVRSALAG
ncbi:MAG: multifunctional CCA tRNA nucleotidyl transferase/2'3'-cyclic phosphodiesterase/2'nucleotidase/phosphatase [Pseudomonadota bacterium]